MSARSFGLAVPPFRVSTAGAAGGLEGAGDLRFGEARLPGGHSQGAKVGGVVGFQGAVSGPEQADVPVALRLGGDPAGQRAHPFPRGKTRCRLWLLLARGFEEPDGRSYQLVKTTGRHGHLDWAAVTRLLQPGRLHQRTEPRPAPGRDLGHLARWVAAQPEGNRNVGLFWAANRALETDQAADLSPLAAAARQAGLAEPEITRTLNSARRTTQAKPEPPGHQAEGGS